MHRGNLTTKHILLLTQRLCSICNACRWPVSHAAKRVSLKRDVPAGTSSSCSLWQRISVMQVMRQLCADAYFLHFLFVTYDAKEVCSMPQQSLTRQPHVCFVFMFVLQHLYSHLLSLCLAFVLPCTWLDCLNKCMSKQAHSVVLGSAPMALCTSTLTLTSASWAAAVNSKGGRRSFC